MPGAVSPVIKPASALRVLRWVVLAFVLMGLGRAGAQDAHRLDLDQTRAALTAAETSLKAGNLDDKGLQALRAQSDALALELQGAIARLTPRLADSTKRLDELTPKAGEAAGAKSGEPAAGADVAVKALESEKQRHDRLDANLRAARAMLLEADDLSTRISAARRQLFAERTFVRSSSVLNPQLWAAVWREVPDDAGVMRSLIGNWFGALGERPMLAKIGMAAIVIALALAAAPLGWLVGRFVYRDLGDKTPSRLRRALAAAWVFVICAALPLLGLGVLAGALELLQPFRSEHAGRDRRRAGGGARPDRRQCAWPRRARATARGLAAHSHKRPLGPNPLSPGDDDRRDLGRRAAG